MMNRTRVQIAWCLLLMATVIAMPRTWIHHCGRGDELHANLDHGSDSDQIEHASCPICDFAGTAGIQPIAPATVLLADWMSVEGTLPQILLSSAPIHLVTLRGPPRA